MELKKSNKANLEDKKNIFFLFGLVFALGITLLAFEWKTQAKKAESLGDLNTQAIEEEIIPITREQEIQPPPPPPPVAPEILNIVDNDVEIEDELIIEDTEADINTLIDVAPVVVAREEEEEEENKVFFIVEEMPEFPGGDLARARWLADNIKYPRIAQENGIQGKVYISFVVGKDGAISNASVARGVDPSLDQEALRVVNQMPKWKPGKQRGEPVNVSFTVPINFVLQ
jgi:protein TonB